MHTLIVALIAIVILGALPFTIMAAKRSSGRGRMAGVTMALGIAFSTIFDPAKAAAIERIDKRNERGDAEAGAGGEKLDRIRQDSHRPEKPLSWHP